MLSWLLHFCFSCFGVSSDLRVKKIRAGGCWVGLAAASCAPSCPFPWAPTPEPFQCQGSPGAALCSPGAWGWMELEVARSCFMQWGRFLLTCSKSLAVVPVTAQCIWGRFPSHSSRTGGEKDLFGFGFRNQAWELWSLLSCSGAERLSRSFKIPARNLSVSSVKQGSTFSQHQAFGFSFTWLWSVVLRCGESVMPCYLFLQWLLSLWFALNLWGFFFFWALVIKVSMATSKLSRRGCPFKTQS